MKIENRRYRQIEKLLISLRDFPHAENSPIIEEELMFGNLKLMLMHFSNVVPSERLDAFLNLNATTLGRSCFLKKRRLSESKLDLRRWEPTFFFSTEKLQCTDWKTFILILLQGENETFGIPQRFFPLHCSNAQLIYLC